MERFMVQCFALLALAVQAHATVITRNVSVTIGPQSITSTTDNLGNTGALFAFSSDLAPFTVQAGDQIVTNITFGRALLIQDAQQDPFYAFPTGLNNLELFFFTFGYGGSNVSGLSTVSNAFVSYSMQLDAIGNPSKTSGSGSVQTDGNGMSAAYFGDQSWTDSTFILRGLTITTNVLSYQLERGSDPFVSINGSIYASRIMAVPEPQTAALLAFGLLVITFRPGKK